MEHLGHVVLLETVVGSTAYGLAGPGSDIDRLATHRAPLRHILGLDGTAAAAGSHVTTNPDRTSHEVGKFVALALRTNPTVTELLWAARYDTVTPEGQMLIDIRNAFLSTSSVRAAYGGYARAQLERLHRRTDGTFSADTRNRVAKHARHCRRLLLQGTELLTTGTLTLDVSAHRDELLHAGELAVTDIERFTEQFHQALAAFDTVPSVLPDTPDRNTINETLIAIRMAELATDPSN